MGLLVWKLTWGKLGALLLIISELKTPGPHHKFSEEIPNDNSQPISKDPFTGVSGERKYIDLLKKLGMPEDIANIFSDDKKENKKERELKTLSENSVRISSNVIALSEKRRIFDKL